MKSNACIAAAIAIAFAASPVWAGERGYFGVAMAIDGDGFFMNPTLKSVKVEKVTPNSAAAKAGLVPGDAIVEVEGRPVSGAKADELKPYLQRDIGQSTRMVVRKADGTLVPVVLVAGPKA